MTNEANDGFGVWAILELMGHVKMAGYVTEEELFGGKIGRIDVPADDEGDGEITQYFGGQSVYRLTPVSEEVARAYARRSRPRPVQTWELQLPAPTPVRYDAAEGEGERDGLFDPFVDDDLPLEVEEEDYFEDYEA